MSYAPEHFFQLEHVKHSRLFEGVAYVWDALGRIEEVIRAHGNSPIARANIEGEVSSGAWVEGEVYIGPGAVVERGAFIQGPAIIGAGTLVRHGAYVRGGCIIGDRCIIGHGTEMKRVIMLNDSHAAHFNYVGDSIVGRDVNLAAGVVLSNFKSDGTTIAVGDHDNRFDTGLRKLGAIIGDGVKTGCNAVTSPGTMIEPGCFIYAGAVLRGLYRKNSVVKLRQQHVIVERKDGGT